MKKTTTLIAFLLFFSFLLNTGIAAEVEIIPKADYSNIQRQNAWNVISVTLRNNGRPIDGTLSISSGVFGKTAVSRNISVGKGTFLYHIPYYCEQPDTVEIRVLTKQGLTVQPVFLEPTPVSSTSFVCLAIGKTGSISRLKQDADLDFYLSYISEPGEMADRWMSYDFADFIMFSSSDLSKLSKEQEDAIMNWLSSGGRIGIAAGKDWQYIRDSFLDGLLPFEITGTVTVPSDEFFSAIGISGNLQGESITVASVESCPEKFVSSSYNNLPLIIKFPYGRGEVVFMAMDPGSEYLRNSPQIDNFWKDIFRIEKIENKEPQSYGYRDNRFFYDMKSKLGRIEGVRQISLGMLSLIFVVYVLVIGPIDYFVLKKLKKQSLTHLTFVFYVIIFSLFAYFYTYRMKGGDMWIRKFIVADINQENSTLNGSTYMMIFSPQNNTYTLPVSRSTAINQTNFDYYDRYYRGGAEGGSSSETLITDKMNELRTHIPIWSARYFHAEWTRQHIGKITYSMKSGGLYIKGSIENNLGTDIEEAYLFAYGKVMVIRSIPNGGTIQLDSSQSIKYEDYRNRYDRYDEEFDYIAAYLSFPETFLFDPHDRYSDDTSNMPKSFARMSLSRYLNDRTKGILIVKCREFDDGIGVRGWNSAKKESFIYLRMVCNIE